MLQLGGLAETTIKNYRKVIVAYAKHLGVPAADVHKYLTVANLLKYASTMTKRSGAGRKNSLSILRRYFQMNGVKFDELQFKAVKPKVQKEINDKPLEKETIRKMFDLTDVHGRAFLSFLISTGARADETCNILLSDVHGDCVNIRNEIAKNGHGGRVYLTAEAREYLDAWLKERNKYIALVDRRAVGLEKMGGIRPKNDARLFGISYASAAKMWCRLYDKVDGSRGKYDHRECTIHSCRKYFRTHAAKTMHPDLVTNLMRQTGYLDSTYVRKSDEEKRDEFFAGESALFITRAVDREAAKNTDAVKKLEQENKELREQMARMEGRFAEFIMNVKITDVDAGKIPAAVGVKSE